MDPRQFVGEVLSPGTARGHVCLFDSRMRPFGSVGKASIQDVGKEIEWFERQVASVAQELGSTAEVLRHDSYLEESEIIGTHILMLDDPVFRHRVHELIGRNRVRAELAVEYVLTEMIDLLERSESELLAERSSDLQDLLLRLKMKLSEADTMDFRQAVEAVERPVVFLPELLPSLVIEAREAGVAAIVVEKGTSLSHAAILARSFGIPVLRVAALPNVEQLSRVEVIVDALEGRLIAYPAVEDHRSAQNLRASRRPGGTNPPVSLWLNVSDPEQVADADWGTLQGIGLYRSELLFMKNPHRFPSEEEQYEAYAQLLRSCGGRPVTIRTLDVGGDKVLPYFSLGPQENPFLGLRATRVFRYHPEILIDQIKAILRSGVDLTGLRILFPMVEGVDDLLFLYHLLDTAIDALRAENKEFALKFQRGVLLEVPSAVWDLPNLLHHVDFVSVGTNDLLQYFFAVDRNNANVQGSYRPENPSALRMLKHVVDTARQFNKQVTLCGEIAADPHVLPLLIGLGFDHFSVDSQALGYLLPFLHDLDLAVCKEVAEGCLRSSTSEEVRDLLEEAGVCPPVRKRSLAGSVNEENVDPVCKMIVHTSGNPVFVTQDRRRYFFCSRYCRQRFVLEQRAPTWTSSQPRMQAIAPNRGRKNMLTEDDGVD